MIVSMDNKQTEEKTYLLIQFKLSPLPFSHHPSDFWPFLSSISLKNQSLHDYYYSSSRY